MKRILFPVLLIILSLQSLSQLLVWSPAFPTESTASFTITMDAGKGNQGLLNYTPATDVYIHTGVITNLSSSSSDWRYVKFNQNFNLPNPALQASYLGNNKWQFVITGSLRAYYGITDPSETIQKIAILFRNGNGSRVQRNINASDMYIPVYTSQLAVRVTEPFSQPTYSPMPEPINKNVGDNLVISGASNNPAALKLYFNGNVIQTASNATSITANAVISFAGEQIIIAEADDGIQIKRDTFRFSVLGSVVTAPLPANTREGINYNTNNTEVTLVLYAPFKTRVSLIGDMPGSNWIDQPQYQMNKTPDGNYWWIRITGLTPGIEYSYQYFVDNLLKIADPYSEKILDPANDPFIAVATYPGLKPYPTGLTTGIVSILQTAASVYTWKNNTFNRPDKRNLLIYEMLLRDLLAAHDWNTLRDTLNYIKNLGINTIELMPANEFEGNISWGYNSSFYFAPDKYYGPANSLKRFIDSAHSKGIAVVMDIALNHSYGQSPMVQLYFDAANNRPAANNPWFNPTARHAFNVGYDMNHESLATRSFTSRVMEHWLKEYKIDGFRFDLSKGFTQTQTCDANGNNCNVNAWSNYDASRVAIWKRYYDTMQLKSTGSYVILEHFAVNTEEKELADMGMLFWGNMNYNFSEAAMGYVSNSNFDQALSTSRGWTNPHLVSYMESHDEERMMYKNLQFGNVAGSYNIKSLPTALKRIELSAAFLLTMPGPKMIWQFGELGYDYSINHCQNGTINNSCRTDPKPIRWGYLAEMNRKNLHDVFASLLKLRADQNYISAFVSNNVERSLSSGFKWMKVTGSPGNIMVIGNFDMTPQTGSVTFQNAGTWYDHISGATINATGAAQSIALQPGEYHVYVSLNPATTPAVTLTASYVGNNNRLDWQVINENAVTYTVESGNDGNTWNPVTTINATGAGSYSYTDVNAAPVIYYRIRSTTTNGTTYYSNVIRITRQQVPVNWSVRVANHPFITRGTVIIETPQSEKVELMISDARGRLVAKQTVVVLVGKNDILLNSMDKLSAGAYVLKVISARESRSYKIVKLK